MERKKAKFFDRIPTELVARIFSHLDKSSKRKARLVNWEFKTILDEHFFKFSGNLTDETFKCVMESTLPLESLRVYDLSLDVVGSDNKNCMSLSRNKFAKSPRQLIFAGKSFRSRHSPYPSVSERNIAKLLELNRNIEVLGFEKNSLEYIYFVNVNGLYLRNLKELDITLSDNKFVTEKNVLLQFGKMKMPSLERVKIDSRILALVFDQNENESFYLRLFQFLGMLKSPSLKSLEFSNNFMLFPFLPQRSSGLPLEAEKLELLKKDLSEIHLTDFSFLFTGHESLDPPYNLGFHLLHHQTTLKKMEVDIPFGSDLLYQEVRDAIERNSQSLQRFSIHSCMFLEIISNFDEIFQALSTCSTLHFLRLRKYKISSLPSGLRLPTLKYFEVIGDLGANILKQIPVIMPALEDLKFWNIIAVSQTKLDTLIQELVLVLQMKKLKTVLWFIGGCPLRPLIPPQNVSVKRLAISHPKHRVYLLTKTTENEGNLHRAL